MTMSEMGMSAEQMGLDAGDNVPVGAGNFAGMPTFTGGDDGAPLRLPSRDKSPASSSAC